MVVLFITLGLVVLILCLIVLANDIVRMAKNTEIAHRKLDNGFQYQRDIQRGTRKAYDLISGEYPKIIDQNAQPVSVPGEGRANFIFRNFAFGTHLPDKGYRLTVESVSLQEKKSRRHNPWRKLGLLLTFRPQKLLSEQKLYIYFCPATCCEKWTVAAVSDSEVTLEHPLMGTLVLKKERRQGFKTGEKVQILQKATKIGESYKVEYKFEA